MIVPRTIPVCAVSLSFVSCTPSVTGTWEVVYAERDGDDVSSDYFGTEEDGTCTYTHAAGLTLLPWDAGFVWADYSSTCATATDGYGYSYAYYVLARMPHARRLLLYNLDHGDDEVALSCEIQRELTCTVPDEQGLVLRFRRVEEK